MSHPARLQEPWPGAAAPFLLVVLPVLVALHGHGLLNLSVAEGLELKPWNLAVPVAICVWLWLVGRGRARPPTLDGGICTLALALSTIWMGVAAMRSPQLPSAAAVFGVQTSNLVLFAAVVSVAGSVRDLGSINRAVFSLGVAVAAASLALYAGGLLAFMSGATETLEGSVVGASLDRGVALRLVGFAEDPNFYSLYMSLPFVIGFGLESRWKWLGLAVIGASVVLAMSRSFFAAFLVSSALMGVPGLWGAFGRSSQYQRAMRRGVLLLAAVVAAAFFLSPELRSFIAARATSVGQQSRVWLWVNVLASWHRPILGEGLRSVDLVVGHFSHNTYLDHLVETGLVGFFFFAAFLSTVMLSGWRSRHLPGAAPWLHAWLIVLAMGATFSIAYSPHLVITAAVLAGLPVHARSPRESDR